MLSYDATVCTCSVKKFQSKALQSVEGIADEITKNDHEVSFKDLH